MQKTQLVYRGTKPRDSDIKELLILMTTIEVIENRFLEQEIKTVTDPYYKIKTLDWTWFNTLFRTKNDISCLILQPGDLAGVGINDHWGFYSLDGDTKHQFYITDMGRKLDPRAKSNGFKSNLAWMFVHEYLHGSVWGNTNDRYLAAKLVHEWEAQGLLKAKLAEDMAMYENLVKQVSILQRLIALVKKKLR